MREPDADAAEPRHISGPLMIGLIVLPIIFYWFLLRPGYSRTARIGAGLYLAFGVALGILRGLRGY